MTNTAHRDAGGAAPAASINPARLAAAEKKSQPPALLNEGQACDLIGVSRRKFNSVRQQPWFIEKCTAIELGPRALRWHRDELLEAMKNAPRRIVQTVPATLARDRTTNGQPA
jgi:hypothetical protein